MSTNKKDIIAEEAIALWVKVGWGKESDYDTSKIRKALSNTFYILSARDMDNNLVGLARVLSDGAIHTNLAEIVVSPHFRKKGIGKLIMDKINEDFKRTGIYLESLSGNEEFFKKAGYIKRDKMQVFSRSSRQKQ